MKTLHTILFVLIYLQLVSQNCGNELACNYNPNTPEWDISECVFPTGCTIPTAVNYDPISECTYVEPCLFADYCGLTININSERAGFVEDFQTSNWIIETNGGDGEVYINQAQLTIYPDENQNIATKTYMVWEGSGGVLSFNYEYFRRPTSLVTQDFPVYFENGVENDMLGSTLYGMRTGTVTVEIDPFGIFGFELPPEYNVICEGPLKIFNLTFDALPCSVGCTYPQATNYDPIATWNDGSCIFEMSTCVGDIDGDSQINTSDLLDFLSAFGTSCQ